MSPKASVINYSAATPLCEAFSEMTIVIFFKAKRAVEQYIMNENIQESSYPSKTDSRFARFADKGGITDGELKEAVDLLEAGLPRQLVGVADLGGDVYKVRIARTGEGKSGGYRVIVFFKSEERTFFVYGFAKSKRGNINEGELKDYKKRAKIALSLTDGQIKDKLRKRAWIEVQ